MKMKGVFMGYNYACSYQGLRRSVRARTAAQARKRFAKLVKGTADINPQRVKARCLGLI